MCGIIGIASNKPVSINIINSLSIMCAGIKKLFSKAFISPVKFA